MSAPAADGTARLFTLGYGNRTPEQVFDLIKSQGCSFLVDVRSTPYSRYHSAYNREALEKNCTDFGLKYLYMGDQLGGIAESDNYCDALGRPDYQKMAQKADFIAAIDRLFSAQEKGVSLALLCAELRPQTCHRSKLIGAALSARGMLLWHIDEHGKLVDQDSVMREIEGAQSDLFS